MSDFGSLAWPQIRDTSDWVGLLPIGAIEVHGPHLPLATDGWIAKAMARNGAEKLLDSGVEALVLPVHHYTPAGFAAGFAGTVNADAAVVEGVIEAAAASVTRAGGSLLAVVNAHFDPANVAAIRAASDRLDVLFFDLTRRRHVERIGGEFATGACHAGRYEGSLMLAIRADLVDEEAARGLPPYFRSLAEAIGEGATSFEEIGGDAAYFGWPADATLEEGEKTLDLIGRMLAEEVLDAVQRDKESGEES